MGNWKSRTNYIVPYCIRTTKCVNNKRCAECIRYSLYKEKKNDKT